MMDSRFKLFRYLNYEKMDGGKCFQNRKIDRESINWKRLRGIRQYPESRMYRITPRDHISLMEVMEP